MGYPGYQRLFSHVAGISSVGRGPTHPRPSGTQAMNRVASFRIFGVRKFFIFPVIQPTRMFVL